MRIAAPWLTAPGPVAVMAAITGGGHAAYFVGGCVRNAVLGAGPTDIDITTDARPDRVTALCEGAGLAVKPTGVDHGTVTVVVAGEAFEVTTFRRDVQTFGRHAVVAFADRLDDDAARRDFTMNALYADAHGEVTDPTGGLADLSAGRVRFVGDPAARIAEDYLRVLRFFRFHAWYGRGDPDPLALAACAGGVPGLAALSAERVRTEVLKLLAAPDPRGALSAMARAGVLTAILPGTATATLTILIGLEQGLLPDPILRLAALGGPDPSARLKLSRAETRRLAKLTDAASGPMPDHELGYRLGATDARAAALLRAAQGGPAPDVPAITDGAAARFPVRAADLMPGLTGEALGTRLSALESAWIAARFAPTKSELLSDARFS
ncbi:MAG: CCA tRNA nucleotidyltransferase [Rhodobacteraceae bacterium]|jgi:poly(A) polymerase|nr:CCA tRNA nucleotidyltransferase [Paracoccaceae bacterium]